MVLISLGTVTIVAMVLWVLTSIIDIVRPVAHAKGGIVIMYTVAALWSTGVV